MLQPNQKFEKSFSSRFNGRPVEIHKYSVAIFKPIKREGGCYFIFSTKKQDTWKKELKQDGTFLIIEPAYNNPGFYTLVWRLKGEERKGIYIGYYEVSSKKDAIGIEKSFYTLHFFPEFAKYIDNPFLTSVLITTPADHSFLICSLLGVFPHIFNTRTIAKAAQAMTTNKQI